MTGCCLLHLQQLTLSFPFHSTTRPSFLAHFGRFHSKNRFHSPLCSQLRFHCSVRIQVHWWSYLWNFQSMLHFHRKNSLLLFVPEPKSRLAWALPSPVAVAVPTSFAISWSQLIAWFVSISAWEFTDPVAPAFPNENPLSAYETLNLVCF